MYKSSLSHTSPSHSPIFDRRPLGQHRHCWYFTRPHTTADLDRHAQPTPRAHSFLAHPWLPGMELSKLYFLFAQFQIMRFGLGLTDNIMQALFHLGLLGLLFDYDLGCAHLLIWAQACISIIDFGLIFTLHAYSIG